MDIRFSLIGFIIGFLVGLTGMGGGSLMTPVMILVMGVKPLIAVGTDLAYSAVTKIVGGAAHLRQHTVNRRPAFLLAVGSIPASIAGVGLTQRIKDANPMFVNLFIMRAIACALILVAVILVIKPFIVDLANSRGTEDNPNWREQGWSFADAHPWTLPAVGAVVGFLVGLTSVGSGTLIVLSLLFLYPRWELKDLVGTDVFHAAMLISAASVAQLLVGNVNVPMMLSLLVGSIPGVLLGSRLVMRFPESLLRWSLATVLMISGAKLL